MRKLSMRKITEVLRLEAAGMNMRDIARSIGAGKTTVCDYLVWDKASFVDPHCG